MNFFEHSARVPLVMAGPDIAKGAVASPCSLVDILPTMIDIATQGDCDRPEFGQPIDGRSLWPMATGNGEDNGDAIGEYCAEMTGHPVFMIRRGDYKYIHCDSDPAQLFNIATDPSEMTNLADDPAHQTIAADFAREVAERWNSDTIRTDVIAKQKQRQSVYNAMQYGGLTAWDYTPPRDASNEYVRNHMDWTVTAAKTRFPPLDS
jgi:choline-sulfatase